MSTKELPLIADELRALIVRGAILPGEHLGQHRLAGWFGRSKIPVREALKLLAAEGFLQHNRNRGYFVAPLEIEEARQLYTLRRWVETELLKTAEWPGEDWIAEFRAGFARLDRIDRRKEYDAWSDTLSKLRYDLFNLSPQKLLLREATRLWSLTDRYRALMPRNDLESPESALVDAFERRDRGALVACFLASREKIEVALEQGFWISGSASAPPISYLEDERSCA